MLTQHLSAEAVEGADIRPFFKAGDEVSYALLHLVGGLVSERQREDAEGLLTASVKQAGDAAGEHLRLA